VHPLAATNEKPFHCRAVGAAQDGSKSEANLSGPTKLKACFCGRPMGHPQNRRAGLDRARPPSRVYLFYFLYLGFDVGVGVSVARMRATASAKERSRAEVQTGTEKSRDAATGSHITVEPVNRFTRHMMPSHAFRS
jgi:hypothetical protein